MATTKKSTKGKKVKVSKLKVEKEKVRTTKRFETNQGRSSPKKNKLSVFSILQSVLRRANLRSEVRSFNLAFMEHPLLPLPPINPPRTASLLKTDPK